MKQEEGVVLAFNGYSGKIMSNNTQYVLTDNNISNKEKIKETDLVTFIPEINNGINMARFVKRKYKDNSVKDENYK